MVHMLRSRRLVFLLAALALGGAVALIAVAGRDDPEPEFASAPAGVQQAGRACAAIAADQPPEGQMRSRGEAADSLKRALSEMDEAARLDRRFRPAAGAMATLIRLLREPGEGDQAVIDRHYETVNDACTTGLTLKNE